MFFKWWLYFFLLILCTLNVPASFILYGRAQKLEKRFYALAYYPHILKVPHFKRRITPKYLGFFERYYVVYLKGSELQRFEVYQDRRLFSRSSLQEFGFVLYQRFNLRKQSILHQKLFYNPAGLLIRQENFRKGRLFSFYSYRYKLGLGRVVKEIFSAEGNFVSRVELELPQLESFFSRPFSFFRTGIQAVQIVGFFAI